MKKYLLLTLLALLNSFVAVAQESYAVFNNGTLTFYYDNEKSERQGTVYDLNIGYIAPDWTNDQSVAQSIYKVVFHTSFADARPVSTCRWFSVDVENNKTSSLSTIEGIENLNTSCVTTMAAMFYGCSVLTTLDLSHFDTSNVTDMQSMFYRCNRLTTLNLNHFDTSNVTNMCMMFYGCAWLAMLDLSYFDTRNVTNMAAMFGGCSNLTTINCGDNWNTDHLESSLNMFMECTSLVGGKGTHYDVSHLDAAYAHVDGGSDNPGYLTDNWTYAHFLDGTLTFYCDKKKYERQGTVYELNSRNNSPGWSDITPSFTKVVFHSSFADARPVSTVGWFYYDETSSLTTIEGIENLNTSRVKTMAFMFVRCTELTTLDLSHFDTSKVTDLCGMFYGCSGMTTLDLSHFDTSSVTDMEELFYGCSGLTTLDLSHLNTSKVTHMERMFEGCSGLTTLDLSHFDTSNVTKMSEMFRDCSNLTTIYCSDKWTTDNVKSSSNMFKGCIKLVGGKGTVYDVNHVNATYAHVDEGTTNPGYLTLKGDTNGDNVIDAQDASLVLQYVAKKISNVSNADVNGDGVVDAQDASIILQVVAKKITW